MNPEDRIVEEWNRRASMEHSPRPLATLRHAMGSRIARSVAGYMRDPLASDGATVATVDRLSADVLEGLFVNHRFCAVHVPSYCSRPIADRLADQALIDPKQWFVRTSGGQTPTDMFFAGGSIPCNVASADRDLFFEYVSKRDTFVAAQRVLADGRWPTDQLRLDLDDAWPGGALIGQFGSGKARPAIIRVMLPAALPNAPAGGFIHVDDYCFVRREAGVGSVNIYLRVPEEGSGGELLVWPVSVGHGGGGARERLGHACVASLLSAAFSADVQQALRSLLPPPVVIKPASGDLVLIHSGRPHSVVTPRLARASLQSFVEYSGVGLPLRLMS